MPSEAEMEAASRLAKAFAELQEAGNAAHEYGLTTSKEAIAAINKLPDPENRVEVAKWLAAPENWETVTHPFMSKSPEQQAEMIPYLAKREDVKGSLRNPETEAWIDARREARREGKRR